MPDALAALNCCYPICCYPISSWDRDNVAVDVFHNWVTNRLAQFRAKTFEFPRDMITLAKLCHLYYKTIALVGDYSSRALVLLDQNLENQPIVPALPSSEIRQGIQLSKDERTRFLRAFFRYETYCCCFFPLEDTMHDEYRERATTYTHPDRCHLFLESCESSLESFLPFLVSKVRNACVGSISQSQQHRNYQKECLLTPAAIVKSWEVEEMFCVYQYLMSKAAKIVCGIVDQFYEDIIEARIDDSCVAVDVVDAVDVFDDLGWKDVLDFGPDGSVEYGLATWDSDSRATFDGFLEHMCRRGLDFLEKWFTSDSEDQRITYVEHGDVRTGHLLRTLECLDESFFAQPKLPITTMEESSRTYNRGWEITEGSLCDASLYRRRQLPHHNLWTETNNQWNTLRDCGYVFWDAPRFRDGRLRSQLYDLVEIGNPIPLEHRLRNVRLLKWEFDEILTPYYCETPGQ